MSAHIPIAAIECGQEEARVTLTEYRGHRLISVWRWYAESNGEMRPGKRGATLPLAKLPDLAAALNAALDRAKADGLLPNGGA
jgi:Transcriptional Coactivator p15 (PC4)